MSALRSGEIHHFHKIYLFLTHLNKKNFFFKLFSVISGRGHLLFQGPANINSIMPH